MSLWRLLLLKSHFHQTPASGRNGKISQTISEPSAGVWNWLPQNLALSDVALFEHIYAKKTSFTIMFPMETAIWGSYMIVIHFHPFSNTPMCICWRLRQSFGMVFPSWRFCGPFFRATNKDSIFSLPNMESATRVSYREDLVAVHRSTEPRTWKHRET